TTHPLKEYISAISVGFDKGGPLLDLCYEEDAKVGTDMNFVMTSSGRFVEIQGTAEGAAFSREEMDAMTDVALKASRELFAAQAEFVGSVLPLETK
ncbi:MAG TPA: hypothetical protein VM432_10660, partial [Bdellovibrionales bacterium]|nr:hypothetical protein [Bdellovibrionales bacterium]